MATRPTLARVKEGLFSALDARNALAGQHVLDLFAGSGALSIEAISRGAASSVAVERSPKARRILQRNCVSVGVEGRVTVLGADIFDVGFSKFVEKYAAGRSFGLVLCDPPFDLASDALRLLERLVLSSVIAPASWVVLEYPERSSLQVSTPLILEKRLRYGDSGVLLLTREQERPMVASAMPERDNDRP